MNLLAVDNSWLAGAASRHEPTTAVFSRRVKPGHETDYEKLAQKMFAASEAFPGQLAATMLHEPGSRDYTIVYSFVDQQTLQVWLESSERRALLGRVDEFAEAHVRQQPLTGLETWFTLPHQTTIKPPPRWKMWLVSLLAIYPFVVAFQALLVPDTKGLPLLLRSALFPLILLTLMTFVVMPLVTRVLQPWLSARS